MHNGAKDEAMRNKLDDLFSHLFGKVHPSICHDAHGSCYCNAVRKILELADMSSG
jgi:hypothetical protein